MEVHFAIRKGAKGICEMLLDGNSFDPTIVFGDLLQCEDPICLGKEFAHIFGKLFAENDISECFERFSVAREEIIENRDFRVQNFDALRSFFGLTYEVDVVRVENLNIPLKFGFCGIQDVLNGNAGQEQLYIYTCQSTTDIAFSIWQYLLSDGYKFKKCEHCGKYFATKSLKIKYCSRISPYEFKKNGPHSCKIAVDYLKKEVKKRRRSICDYLRNYYPKAQGLFCQEIDEISASIPPNSVEYFEYLIKVIMRRERVKNTWYTERYK